jgi:hypothetical protein
MPLSRLAESGAAAALVGLAVACGHDSALPSGPVAPTASSTITAIAVDGPRLAPTGSNVTYAASAMLSSGSKTPNVRPTAWTTDNTDVAVINSAPDGIGELTARREGMVTITATHQGRSGTFSIEVRDTTRLADGAFVDISYSPNPVPGAAARCPASADPGVPTWTFTESIAETQGVGFTRKRSRSISIRMREG